MKPDCLNRFLFENAPIRGEIVHLDATWQTVLARCDYPEVLRQVMGELMAAAALLAATLKLKGSLMLQIQGKGPVTLLLVECSGQLTMRATAKWQGELPVGGLSQLMGDGRFVITLDLKEGKQTYQGVVPLEGGSVAEMLQAYMTRSEQLETRLFLAADELQTAGMLLQKLPDQDSQDEDAWSRICHLAATLKPEELLDLPANQILHRLFHEEDIRLFDPQAVSFFCGCSRANVSNVLRMLGHKEIDSILAKRNDIEVHCDFCNQRYLFDRIDAEQVFATKITPPGSQTRH